MADALFPASSQSAARPLEILDKRLGVQHISTIAPTAAGQSESCRVGLTPTGKSRSAQNPLSTGSRAGRPPLTMTSTLEPPSPSDRRTRQSSGRRFQSQSFIAVSEGGTCSRTLTRTTSPLEQKIFSLS